MKNEIQFDEKIEKDEEETNSEEENYEVSTQGTDWTLEVLSIKITKGDIGVPKFQRKTVWDIVKRSKLIDSFLRGFPVPNIFLYKGSDNKLAVIDGQQRLFAIKDFFDGKYKLKKIGEEWNDKFFSELSASDKLKLEDSVIRATIISSITPENPELIFRIFERLNTGGVKLNDQEIRNGIWGGILNDELIKLNLNENWRSLLGSKNIDNRFKDVEMILRFFALFEEIENYRKPLNEFLTNYLSLYKDDVKDDVKDYFIQTIDIIHTKIGVNAFRLEKTINKAFFDAISVGIAVNIKNDTLNTEKLNENYIQLKEKLITEELVSNSTTSTKTLNRRIKLAIEQFKK